VSAVQPTVSEPPAAITPAKAHFHISDMPQSWLKNMSNKPSRLHDARRLFLRLLTDRRGCAD
jgi:hypothetical protein